MTAGRLTRFGRVGLPILCGLAFVCLAWFRLVVKNADLLYEAQEQSLWVSGNLFFRQCLLQPGGVFTWAGRYLTQFFYYPALGASMLILLWLLIYFLIYWGCHLKWHLCWLALLPSMLLLWAETSLGYWIYTSDIPDWWFSPTLFVLFASLCAFCAFRLNRLIRIAWQVICLLSVLCVGHTWMEEARVPDSLRVPFHATLDDSGFKAEMRMERAALEGRWPDILREMRQTRQKPTRAMWMFKNAALLNEGRLAEAWLDYSCLTRMPAANDSANVSMVCTFAPTLYYLNGSIEFSYRWNMENMVSNHISVQRLRLMSMCALVKGEYDLAGKYLNLLSKTSFHRKWAEAQRKYLANPSAMRQDPCYRVPLLLSQDCVDLLDTDSNQMESWLVSNYSARTNHNNPLLSELSLIYTMQLQSIPLFWPQFGLYARLHQDKPMPRVIQEAVFLYQTLEPQTAPAQRFPFDSGISQTYVRFQQRSQMLMQQGYSEEALAEAMRKEFGKTFYWFYFFCRDLYTY